MTEFPGSGVHDELSDTVMQNLKQWHTLGGARGCLSTQIFSVECVFMVVKRIIQV